MSAYVSHGELETIEIGASIGAMIAPRSVVALTGPLGSGKTALVRGICRHFGCDAQLTSPTFTIINVYEGRERIYHCDLYRLHGTAELFSTGFEEVLYSDGIVLVEWAERALDLLPERRHEITLAHGATPDIRTLMHRMREAGEPTLLDAGIATEGRPS